MPEVSILIADDHPAFRGGLRQCLENEKDFNVIAEASNGKEAIEFVQQFHPDVALLDINMPLLSGLDAASKIKETCPDTAIIILSAFDYRSYVVRSLRAGASGYLIKTTPLPEIVAAIRMVHAGRAAFDLKSTGKILHDLASPGNDKTAAAKNIGSREMEILSLTARGLSNKEIALNLSISERTVQSHLLNIFSKLGVNSRIEAVLAALKQGWLTIDDIPAPFTKHPDTQQD